ncbi:MAG: alpha-glucosidase, partial [Acidobacteriaceae bacterium]|nr:alpha-glucosidase [Acidobacteriaceae bacterium]
MLERDNRTIVLEPYAPNIVRITLSERKQQALGPPGYGIVATPSMTGWTHEQDAGGYDVIRSGQMILHVAPQTLPPPHPMPLDALNQSLRERYFGSGNPNPPHNDTISITTAAGKPLLTMWNWSMIPNPSEKAPGTSQKEEKEDPGSRVSATFDSPEGEHY